MPKHKISDSPHSAGTDIIFDLPEPDDHHSWDAMSNHTWVFGHEDYSLNAPDTIVLPEGVEIDDLTLSQGTEIVEGINWESFRTPNSTQSDAVDNARAAMAYDTLEISWGEQKVEIILPHLNDPRGTGIEAVRFSNGIELSLSSLMSAKGMSFAPSLLNTGIEMDYLGLSANRNGVPLTFVGSSGNDKVIIHESDAYGFGGDDHLETAWNSSSHRLSLFGGEDNDTLVVNTTGSYADGGLGNDTLVGNAFGAWLEGGLGNDTLVVKSSGVEVNGGGGNDLYLVNDNFQTRITGSVAGDDKISFGPEFLAESLSYHKLSDMLVVLVDNDMNNFVTVDGFFGSSDFGSYSLRLDTGTILSREGITSLVTELPAYETNTAATAGSDAEVIVLTGVQQPATEPTPSLYQADYYTL